MAAMRSVLRSKLGFTLVELMIVIVIVGILAAVAIPKFVRSADKARASEFPTVLTGIYTQQEAYKAEMGSYLAAFDANFIPDPSPQSEWFTYTNASGSATAFTATATVAKVFGNAAVTDKATIDQDGTKTATASLESYVPSWK